MKKLSIKCVMLCLVGFGCTGCVAQGQYDKILQQYRQTEEQNEQLRWDLSEARARLKVLEERTKQPDQDLLNDLAAARAEVTRLEAALQETEQKIRQLAAQDEGPLPAELDDELEKLAQDHSGLMTYDAKRGMVKFLSDLTFASGSDKVEAKAAAGLTQLANILNMPIARSYEVRIVGHTDNVPIRYSIKRHPSNWHLSVHRSIAVMKVLAGAAVPEPRINVAGYGEHRPIAANIKNGHRANRRVEIYLVPNHYDASIALRRSPQAQEPPEPRQVPEPSATEATANEPPEAFK